MLIKKRNLFSIPIVLLFSFLLITTSRCGPGLNLGKIRLGASLKSYAPPRFLYAVYDNGPSFIAMFSVNPNTGALTSIATDLQVSCNGCSTFVYLAVDPLERFVYVADSGTNKIWTVLMNSSTGILTTSGTFTTLGSAPTSLAVDPAGQFLYSTDANSGVSYFSINSSTGALTLAGSFSANTPNAIVLSPNGQYAYVTNQSTNQVSMLSINSNTGVLTSITTDISAQTNPSINQFINIPT